MSNAKILNFNALINAAREQSAERIANIKANRFNDYTNEDLASAEAEGLQIEAQAAALEAYGSSAAQREAVEVVTGFATSARKQYAATKELTTLPSGTCMTIRVPVAMLNRIKEMGDLFGIPQA